MFLKNLSNGRQEGFLLLEILLGIFLVVIVGYGAIVLYQATLFSSSARYRVEKQIDSLSSAINKYVLSNQEQLLTDLAQRGTHGSASPYREAEIEVPLKDLENFIDIAPFQSADNPFKFHALIYYQKNPNTISYGVIISRRDNKGSDYYNRIVAGLRLTTLSKGAEWEKFYAISYPGISNSLVNYSLHELVEKRRLVLNFTGS